MDPKWDRLGLDTDTRTWTHTEIYMVVDGWVIDKKIKHKLGVGLGQTGLQPNPVHSPNCVYLHLWSWLCYEYFVFRYLYIRWGVDLSSMVVLVGESGDTDYELLFGGVHKTVILSGICRGTQSRLLAGRTYPLEDVVPFDSPNIVQTTEGYSSNDIQLALGKLGIIGG